MSDTTTEAVNTALANINNGLVRLADLDTLRTLAARVAELEAENSRLRDDPCAALEGVVLNALPGKHAHHCFGFDYFSCLDAIADDAGVDKEAARFACKRLRDKGLAIYQSGLFNEDGAPAGAGYALTNAGRAAIQGDKTND